MSDDEGKKPKKKPKTEEEAPASNVKTYEERVKAVNAISSPLASKKTTKKCHKLVKKASSAKRVRRGVKEVVKGIRKGDKGLAILAGDIFPIDVVSHLPILFEEKGVPYLFVPSKQDLGAAASTKRPTSCVLIKAPEKGKEFDGEDIYDALVEEAKSYDPTKV
uniref:H/ACA ribonucleoprotein complex subunit 2 n=1 Tax=Trieres chinensis TaxID=1514140 RepID=A0A7S1Z812_TRICV|mmetsp:Transcript_19688/g.39905  ORF Transcript_19688/g.39905 Transcript_19688/m.39905 type:complete len:163 (+) Transcript_19688:258-746(+)